MYCFSKQQIDTHVDHFWCLVSKYTDYDNIFIN